MMNSIYKFPHDAVQTIEQMNNSIGKVVEQTTGFVYIDVNKISYFRDYNDDCGLIHFIDGVDMMINKEWFNKFVKDRVERKTLGYGYNHV